MYEDKWPTSPYKTTWWKVDLGGVYSIYSVTILFKNYNGYEDRQSERFAVFSLCNIPCPLNCKDSICNIQNGSCIGCKSGWTGQSCSKKCSERLYGVNCSQQCKGHCRDGTTCNHVTGQCDRGCGTGWTGSLCGKECDEGTYGYDCVNNCSGHCLNGSLCNKQTGHCDEGCDLGNNCSEGTSYLQRTETTPASTSWIVGFSISVSVNVILISVILIMLWRFLVNGQHANSGLPLSRRCTSNGNRIEAADQIIK
uniref:Multiple epidermal growth factor-like domains 10 n=1 Tax=Magallana gigas TaxID=29159 RepID=A0A8W8NYI9_MAGGI